MDRLFVLFARLRDYFDLRNPDAGFQEPFRRAVEKNSELNVRVLMMRPRHKFWVIVAALTLLMLFAHSSSGLLVTLAYLGLFLLVLSMASFAFLDDTDEKHELAVQMTDMVEGMLFMDEAVEGGEDGLEPIILEGEVEDLPEDLQPEFFQGGGQVEGDGPELVRQERRPSPRAVEAEHPLGDLESLDLNGKDNG